MLIYNLVPPEGLKAMSIQCWFSDLALACRDCSGFSESSEIIKFPVIVHYWTAGLFAHAVFFVFLYKLVNLTSSIIIHGSFLCYKLNLFICLFFTSQLTQAFVAHVTTFFRVATIKFKMSVYLQKTIQFISWKLNTFSVYCFLLNIVVFCFFTW